MALSINWNWAVPKIQVSNASEQSMGNALSSIGESIGSLQRARYQKEQNRLAQERQERLDATAEEDRQRRIAEEERKKALYGEAAGILRNEGSDDLASLKEQQKQLMSQIAQIKNTWGI
jgi:thermostable 8-oxoguanine DNA glycosylase